MCYRVIDRFLFYCFNCLFIILRRGLKATALQQEFICGAQLKALFIDVGRNRTGVVVPVTWIGSREEGKTRCLDGFPY